MSPPDPTNVKAEVVTESGAHVFFFTNGAMSIGRDREDPDEGVWLDNIDKQELHQALEDHNEWEPGHPDS